MRLHALVGLLLLWQDAVNNLDVLVVDGSNGPVAGVRVVLMSGGKVVASAQTSESGHAQFSELTPARYEPDASKEGFEPVQKNNVEVPARLN
jgi:uncharacterized protein YfaS (alpha-2-macroglobulin family)